MNLKLQILKSYFRAENNSLVETKEGVIAGSEQTVGGPGGLEPRCSGISEVFWVKKKACRLHGWKRRITSVLQVWKEDEGVWGGLKNLFHKFFQQ